MEWTATMITPAEPVDGAPVLRCEFPVDAGHGAPTRAVLHASSLGVFEAVLNGTPVSDEVLCPGWTSYEWRLRYRSVDVTGLLAGENELAVTLGRGWWAAPLGWERVAPYGERVALIAELHVEFADGHRQVVVTDDTWTASASDTVADDLYDGQTIDARRRDEPQPAVAVEALAFDPALLTPYVGPPVVRHESIAPQRVWTSPSGRTLVDFGQNLVGWIRARVGGAAGDVVTIRHAEVLDDDELGVRPLRTAEATDRFVLSGGDDEFEPTLTFHGFRYAEVTGWPGDLGADRSGGLEAVVVHSDLRRTGWFECSDPLVSQLHRNVVWGLRGNVLDVPTDCPQRDERLGWTGDLAVFAPAAAFLYDVGDFLADWLLDLAAEAAAADGRVPLVVPDLLRRSTNPFAGLDSVAVWSDAAAWVPWALWDAYGDESALAAQYPSMVAHVRRVASLTSPNGLWDTGFQLGDWLDPDAPPDQPWAAKADRSVVATACLYRSADLAARAAEVLGRADDERELAALAGRTEAAFTEHFVHDDGTIRSDAATVYALAIVFGLVRGDAARRAGDRLAALVEAAGFHVSTGFAGTPYVCDALTVTGHVDHAYRLLLERTCPSWLYAVEMGATTVWERWDSMLPDGSLNPGEMTSFNHYALGAVADWLHRTVGGIAPAAPGYGRVRIAPRPGGDITWARTRLDSRHGPIAVEWRVDGDALTVAVDLPGGVPGVLDLDGLDPIDLPSGPSEHRVG